MPLLNQWIVLPLLYTTITTKCVDMYYCYYSTYINTGLNILTSLLIILLLPKRFQSQNILLLPSFSSFMDPLDFILAIHSQFCLFSYSMSHHLLLYAKFPPQKNEDQFWKTLEMRSIIMSQVWISWEMGRIHRCSIRLNKMYVLLD